MAEARLAVAFQFAVNEDGELDVMFNKSGWMLLLQSLKRSLCRSLKNMSHQMDYYLFPVVPAPLFVLLMYSLVISGFVFHVKVFSYALFVISTYMPGGSRVVQKIFTTIFTPILLCILISKLLQFVLRQLIWIRMAMESIPAGYFKNHHLNHIFSQLKDALKYTVDKSIGENYGTYSLENSLPYLPVPSLKDTLNRWLKSVRPLTSDKEYDLRVAEAEKFQNGVGKTLQRLLVLKSWLYDNYVTDWWVKYVYLSSRTSIMINSNYYCMDTFTKQSYLQASRTANIISGILDFRKRLFNNTLRPIFSVGNISLCSNQYRMLFNTNRLPCHERDELVHSPKSDYIVVVHRGKFFKLNFVQNGVHLNNVDIEKQLEFILNHSGEGSYEEIHLGALTALNREEWATIRIKHFSKGINQESYDIISRSAFVLYLSDETCTTDDSASLTEFGKQLLHGKGYNAWFDKSFVVIAFKNGKVGLNVEHSWGDAPIISHMFEYVTFYSQFVLGFNDDKTCKGVESPISFLYPQRINWDLNLVSADITSALSKASDSIADLHLCIYPFTDFGKGAIKALKTSPDAFIQTALQLAYYKDIGHFDLTYEASTVRMFKHGRTETVRACTSEKCAFVRSIDDPLLCVEEKVKLYRDAAKNHVQLFQKSMFGMGCDRHLFCLYVASKVLGYDIPFLKNLLSEPWQLSTSQTPVRLEKFPYPGMSLHNITAGGGFGPVSDSGYGVSYIICGEDLISFHVTSKRSCPTTDSDRMMKNICKALHQMKDLISNESEH